MPKEIIVEAFDRAGVVELRHDHFCTAGEAKHEIEGKYLCPYYWDNRAEVKDDHKRIVMVRLTVRTSRGETVRDYNTNW